MGAVCGSPARQARGSPARQARGLRRGSEQGWRGLSRAVGGLRLVRVQESHGASLPIRPGKVRPAVRRGEERFTSEARGGWRSVGAGRKATPGRNSVARSLARRLRTGVAVGPRDIYLRGQQSPASSLGEETAMYKENPSLWKHGAATCSTCSVWVERGKTPSPNPCPLSLIPCIMNLVLISETLNPES